MRTRSISAYPVTGAHRPMVRRSDVNEGGAAVSASVTPPKSVSQRIWLLVVVCIGLAASVVCFSNAAEARIGALWSARLAVQAKTATLGDLTGDGIPELIVASENRVHVYVWDEKTYGYIEQMSFNGFPAAISVLAVGRPFGDERSALWVGMHGSGPIQLYTLQEHALVHHGTIGRLWSDVEELYPVDIDGNGAEDLVALGADGVVSLWYNENGSFRQAWRTPPSEEPDRYVAVGDYFGSDRPALVTAKERGRVMIYEWQESPTGEAGTLVKRHENYPWGVIASVDLIPVASGGRADLFIATDQNLLYRYSWQGGVSRLVDQWNQNVLHTAEWVEAIPTGASAGPLWLGLKDNTLRSWRLTPAGLEPAWGLPAGTEWIAQSPSGHLIVFDATGLLRVLGPVPDDFLRVERGGEGYRLQYPPIFEGDEVFLAAADWARILSLRAWSSRGGNRYSGLASLFTFFIVDAGSDVVSVNGRSRVLSAAPRLVDGQMYLPLSFAEALGFTYEWFAPLRHLRFD